MPILLNETRNPNDQALTDYPTSFGRYIENKASEAFSSNYVTGLLPTQGAIDAAQTNLPLNWQDMQNAYDPVTGMAVTQVEPVYGPPKAKISKQDADGRIKDAGVKLTVPDDGIVPDALELMIRNQQDRIARQVAIEASPNGARNVAGFATAFAVSALDPLNLASAFVPVIGEMRYTALLAGAGGAFGRTAVRAGVGAAEGLVGSVLVEPLIYGMNQQLQNDYTMTDSLANIAFGTAFGGGLHMIGGGVREAYRGLRGLPNDFDYLRGLTMREAMDVQRFRADFAAGKVTDVEAATANFSTRMREAAGIPERPADVGTEAPRQPVRTEPVAPEAPFARMYEMTPETAQARALGELRDEIRADLTATAGNRAEAGAVAALREQITRQDQTIARLGGEQEFKTRAKALQADGMSRKEAEAAARKAIDTERADAQATRDRLQEQVDTNAKASQAEQALAELEKGNVPAEYADRVQARAQQLMGAAQIAGAVNRMTQPPASMIAQMATPEQQAAALRVAVGQMAQGQSPNVEPIMITSGIDQLQAAAEHQQSVGASLSTDPEGAAAATRRYEQSAAKDAKLEVAEKEAEKAQAQLDAAIKNLEASGASPELIAKLRAEAAAGQDSILYSQGMGAGSTVEEVRAGLGKDVESLVADGRLVVVQSVEELPARADGEPHPADTKGLYDGERGYLVADNIGAGEARGVMLHEMGVHYGMENMLGPKLFRELLSEVEAKAKAGIPEFAAALAKIPADTKPEKIKEELLAYLVQNQPDMPLVKRVIAAIREFIYRVTGGKLIDLTADDLVMMAVASVKKISSAEAAGAKVVENGNLLTATSRAGNVAGEIRSDGLHITSVEVAVESRGQGEGVKLYRALVDDALRRGMKVYSANTLQPEAAQLYGALARRGYEVTEREGTTRTKLGTVMGKDGQPAFEITGRTVDYARGDAQNLKIQRSMQQLVKDAESQGTWKDWYNRHEQALVDLFGGDAPLFQKLLSVTSQAASVKANVGLAVKAYRQLLAGEPFEGYLPAVIKNLERVRDEQAIQGQKIGEYAKANDGAAGGIAVDRHISQLFFGSDRPTPAQVDVAKKRIIAVAEKLGWEPRQVQAALWAFNQVKNGADPAKVVSYDTVLLGKADQIADIRTQYGRGEAGSVQAGRPAVAGADVAGGGTGRAAKIDPAQQAQAGIIEDIQASTKTFDAGVKDAEAMGEAVNAAALCGLRS